MSKVSRDDLLAQIAALQAENAKLTSPQSNCAFSLGDLSRCLFFPNPRALSPVILAQNCLSVHPSPPIR